MKEEPYMTCFAEPEYRKLLGLTIGIAKMVLDLTILLFSTFLLHHLTRHEMCQRRDANHQDCLTGTRMLSFPPDTKLVSRRGEGFQST